MNMRQVAGPRPERKRFEVYTRDGVSQVWDHVEEASVFMTSGSEDAAQGLADRLNENACAICGEQCEEAHSQTRLGRVCERCTDEYIDENGELKE